jgi:hypothetical protein
VIKVESRRLRDFLPGFGLGPGPRHELLNLGDLGHRQPGEQILQILKGIDPMPPTTAQQRVDHRTAFASLILGVKPYY